MKKYVLIACLVVKVALCMEGSSEPNWLFPTDPRVQPDSSCFSPMRELAASVKSQFDKLTPGNEENLVYKAYADLASTDDPTTLKGWPASWKFHTDIEKQLASDEDMQEALNKAKESEELTVWAEFRKRLLHGFLDFSEKSCPGLKMPRDPKGGKKNYEMLLENGNSLAPDTIRQFFLAGTYFLVACRKALLKAGAPKAIMEAGKPPKKQ